MLRSFRFLLPLLGLLLIAAGAASRPPDRDPHFLTRPLLSDAVRDLGMLHGGVVGAPAKVDTVYLLGGPGRLDGRFEDAAGQPAWHGWTSEDRTAGTDTYWSVTDEPDLVIGGQYSLWCGVVYPEPGPIPVPGFGYGNDWVQNVVFTHTVADPAAGSTVTWSLLLQHDTEPVYDFVFLQWNRGGQWVTLQELDGVSSGALPLHHAFYVAAEDHAGPSGDQIQLRVRFVSDAVWSDEDGLWPTSRGACQVDDIAVDINGEVVSFEDFESGASTTWVPVLETGVGDFAQLWTGLGDLDPCRSNWTPQVAFIDDGVVVPGTGGTMCITWCYGPGGYIVNNSGGLQGPGGAIDNQIVSPPLAWPAAADACFLAFDVYRHENGDSGPYVYYRWHVRSVDTGDPDDLAAAPWVDHSFLYYGGPQYIRQQFDVSGLLTPGRTHVQVALRVWQYFSPYAWPTFDGTPAPYFDNVAVVAYAQQGPAITAREIDLAQDNFPTQPFIDLNNLASNAVRFDMARNIAPLTHQMNRPGDTLIVDVRAVRPGTELLDLPRLHVAMKANPLFDSVRVLPDGFTQDGGVVTGSVAGEFTYNAQGALVPDRFNFDLPDHDFFFPGDVIHYYIKAVDTGGGVSTLPADLTTFGQFDPAGAFDRVFTVRALPSRTSGVTDVLFWDDSGGQSLDRWRNAFAYHGMIEGVDYDVYATNGAAAGVGNGLGGRAAVDHLEYKLLVYNCGNLSTYTLSNGDFNHDPGDDIGLLTAWIDAYVPPHGFSGRGLLMTGDDLVFSLLNAGAAGQVFVGEFLGVSLVDRDIRPLINNQTAPLIRTIDVEWPVFRNIEQWVLTAGCPGLPRVDAVVPASPQTVRLAEFTAPTGEPGAYPFAAAVWRYRGATSSEIVMLPYGIGLIADAPGRTAARDGVPPAYVQVIDDVLLSLLRGPAGSPPGAPGFAVNSFPNPFNPATTIRLQVPAAGDVSVAVYNVRGELVRTLLDERLDEGQHDVLWDGRDRAGAPVASGVYFHQVRHGQEVKVGKMLLMK